ncbi:hypothetical protein P152DRAFT_391965 [Eremomyces bilateralis CBS 781.70]|uniref:DUF1680-domain-containing protein n=1 Tax=Eremomyces bilateralis CBS 781.70 TaxID=1392243 RepID=A0A6G1GB88_9PEZI|nr:uncharacterized protein P152DRAFT_391965 [Eremomyces bilateralis CBS 781.70]KAF1815284.1 hypothetical protein P152DRAFT_391965 [Eremomyces bilateralis CBS 781.70]
MPSSSDLIPFVFDPLPLGSIKPAGWLHSELQTMAAGLPGHEYDFYRFVKYSPWLGGDQEYALLNEGFPYWFNGIVPLAYSLDDERLKIQIHGAVSFITAHQAADGWLGPETGTRRNFWARFPVLLGMIGLLQADYGAYSGKVLPSIQKFVGLMHTMLENDFEGYLYHEGSALSEFDHTWARVRMADCMISLQWLLEHEPAVQKESIIRVMELLVQGSIDWATWFQEGTFVKLDPNDLPDGGRELENQYLPYMHGVNLGQGLKSGAVVRRLTRNETLLQTTRRGVQWTFEFHGAASGTILADERIAGLEPYYGSELCTTVEALYSLAYLYSALGDPDSASRAELIAYNALPAITTPDHWAHQYVSQPNQPDHGHIHKNADPARGNPFWNVGAYGQTFGLELNYPCCTVNQGQGWPKFVANSWMRYGEDGIVHALLGPSRVRTSLRNADVSIECKTAYPFDLTLRYEIECAGPFTFYFRVPEWAQPGSTLEISSIERSSVSSSGGLGQARRRRIAPGSTDIPGGLHAVPVLSAGKHIGAVKLIAAPRTEPRMNDTVAVFYGPLLYSLHIDVESTSHNPVKFDGRTPFDPSEIPPEAKDWSMTPSSPWAVAIDPSTLSVHNAGVPEDGSLPNPVWAPGVPPISITVKGCEIEWPLYGGKTGHVRDGRIPDLPPSKELRKCIGPVQEWKLVPHGSAKIHMSDLPVIDLSES